ncbi:hypothetical protein ABB37_03186 [Leptomonas pyrrhocoris]|uniref:Uncharacterized protein n=1 Tax=Leptomonas pyrrhocoris TaxID=157538 RepID=A0A0M9G427_LEPPY|nr:hypothetical protein ABB37_03186 [Leptomonas pyrrhocoris]KPA82010.1 hypothetical protein ABB37_03186 [Leptomonas pyrrhocoris]|eukprot:XP_015660449.1 hypothetical protein ABB37_03186 [Leptomonas pyrrhocoris]
MSAAMNFGEKEPPVHPSGRAHVALYPKGGLTFGSTGLMPSAANNSVAVQRAPLHHRFSPGVRAGVLSGKQHPQGRRHLDPNFFTNLSDDAKREEGRYGRAHVASEQQQQADAYYSTKQSSVEQPPGEECNLYLKSYYYTPLSKADRASPPPKVPVSDVGNGAQSTSFKLAEGRLRRLKAEHPEYEAEVNKVLREEHGDYAIVRSQEKLSRKAAVAEYAKGSDARVKQIAATTKYHGAPNLGSPTPSIERNVPYALDDSRSRQDTQLTSNSHVRLFDQRNRRSAPVEPPVKPRDRREHESPVPYDSADVSKEQYPSPPPIGVRQGIYAKPTMVHIDPRNREQCGEDVDTLNFKRARARSGASQSQESRPDFIFGTGPAPRQPRPTLAQRTESRWKAQERDAEERRTGKAFYPQAYPETSLW